MKKKRLTTKEKLRVALIDLLGEKGITEIKINELTKAANVSRGSFYRNFDSIDALLDYTANVFAEDFTNKYIMLLFSNDYKLWYDQTEKILTGIYQNKEHFNDTLTNNLKVVFSKIQQIFATDKSHIWKDDYKKYEHISKISSFYAVAMMWIKDGAKKSIPDMTDFMLTHIMNINKVA